VLSRRNILAAAVASAAISAATARGPINQPRGRSASQIPRHSSTRDLRTRAVQATLP
jgi:hypothetical protein